MSRIKEKVETIHVEELLTGLCCDVCGSVHQYEKPPEELLPGANYVLQPEAVGWEHFSLMGTNGAWDVCPPCIPKVRAFFRAAMPTFFDGRTTK